MMRWPWTKEPEARSSGGSYYRPDSSAHRGRGGRDRRGHRLHGSRGGCRRGAGARLRFGDGGRAATRPRSCHTDVPGAVRAATSFARASLLHVIDVNRAGRAGLIVAAQWHFEGGDSRPDSWTVEATTYGPNSTTTVRVPYSGVVHLRWGSRPGQPEDGIGPLSWAHTTANLQSRTERSACPTKRAGRWRSFSRFPATAGTASDDDPLKLLKADIGKAKGAALLVETVMAGFGEGRGAAPARDWIASRLGPNPPEALAGIRNDAFDAVLSACGLPPSLFKANADGTAQREALRRWHLGTVLPLAGLIEDELSEKLEAEVRLRFDSYPLDMVSRASVVDKLVRAGVSTAVALAAVGLDDG